MLQVERHNALPKFRNRAMDDAEQRCPDSIRRALHQLALTACRWGKCVCKPPDAPLPADGGSSEGKYAELPTFEFGA